MRVVCCTVLCLLVLGSAGFAAEDAVSADVERMYPELEKLYIELHQNPELSLQEFKTAARLAGLLRPLGYDVTEKVGGTGVVAVLKNGPGPVVLFRTDMDGLPVEEKSGVPYASKAKTADGVPTMHACGHDLHMAAWVGTARWMAANKPRWSGTLVMIAQPAEEVGKGAQAMLKDGLYTKFPKPNFALAMHDAADLPAGKVGVISGYALANADTLDITIFGRGGHGAYPHMTVDPIVLAARIVMGLQTLVSRENNPLDPAVITVGQIHGGTKDNIIPDQVKLGLSIRSYKPEVREALLKGIERVARAEATAAGAPRMPEFQQTESTKSTYNDPELTKRMEAALRNSLGAVNVVTVEPKMAAEDFSEYRQQNVPSFLMWVGAVNPKKYAEAQKTGATLPSLHSPLFAPDPGPSIRTAVVAEIAVLLDLLGKR